MAQEQKNYFTEDGRCFINGLPFPKINDSRRDYLRDLEKNQPDRFKREAKDIEKIQLKMLEELGQ